MVVESGKALVALIALVAFNALSGMRVLIGMVGLPGACASISLVAPSVLDASVVFL